MQCVLLWNECVYVYIDIHIYICIYVYTHWMYDLYIWAKAFVAVARNATTTTTTSAAATTTSLRWPYLLYICSSFRAIHTQIHTHICCYFFFFGEFISFFFFFVMVAAAAASRPRRHLRLAILFILKRTWLKKVRGRGKYKQVAAKIHM